jgi:hypothetical protein
MSQRHPQHRRGTNHLSSPRQLLQLINSGRVAQLGEHLLCKKAGKITQVPHLVSLTRNGAVQPTP